MSSIFQEPYIDYDWIKRTAKHSNCSVNDLIALSSQNDPFYTGTVTDRALAEWFTDLWQQIGDERMHIRRVHYWLVSQVNVLLPSGRMYENTLECWDVLNLASKAARYLGLVNPEAFNDRRTPEVQIYASSRTYRPSVTVNGYFPRSGIKLPDFPDLPDFTIYDYLPERPYYLEMWCEKSTMNDILSPLCQRYGLNLQTGMGEMSITSTLSLVRRLQEANKPARVLYISDFDPAGQSMPVAMSRKIEFFVRRFELDLDIRVFPVVLTLEQVRQYELPRTPIKESEKRRAGFEQRHGEGAVELDSLEALHPGTLEAILSQCIEQYYDVTLDNRVQESYQALSAALEREWNGIVGEQEQVIAAYREEYDELRYEFEERLSSFNERLQVLWHDLKKEMQKCVGLIDDYPVPVAPMGYELGEGLYNTERSYLEQIEAYKHFQGRL